MFPIPLVIAVTIPVAEPMVRTNPVLVQTPGNTPAQAAVPEEPSHKVATPVMPGGVGLTVISLVT